jgi:hypothetical protein
MEPIKILSATGILGTGFKEETFEYSLSLKPDVIACDAGSTDAGPHFLGAGVSYTSRQAVKRDLTIMMKGAITHNIPLLIGSVGNAGGDVHVDWTVDIVKEIAAEQNLSFKLGYIYSEVTQEKVLEFFRGNKMRPLQNAPEMTEERIKNLTRIVGVMGPHPFMEAVENGAQIVIAGRSSDTSIYAAVPILKGLDTGATWHAAKILECGAASVERRQHPDCHFAWVYPDHFIVEPPNPNMRCTPLSVVSHMLYENTDPFHLYEPSGMLDASEAVYEPHGERGVKVSGSKYIHSNTYTIKLEGVRRVGYKKISIAGIRDPIILKQLPNYIQEAAASIRRKVKESVGLAEDQYLLNYRVYGESAVLGELEPNKGKIGHEVGLFFEVIAETPELSSAVMAIASHTILHHPVKEYSGFISNTAYPFSPPSADMGATYEFAINHIVEVEHPNELFRINYVQI